MSKLEIINAINTLAGLLEVTGLTGDDKDKVRAKIMELIAQL